MSIYFMMIVVSCELVINLCTLYGTIVQVFYGVWYLRYFPNPFAPGDVVKALFFTHFSYHDLLLDIYKFNVTMEPY